jgi:hypothetical protein
VAIGIAVIAGQRGIQGVELRRRGLVDDHAMIDFINANKAPPADLLVKTL